MEATAEKPRPLEINFPKEPITQEDIELVKEYIEERKKPILFTYKINDTERKGAIVATDLGKSKYSSLGYITIKTDEIWKAIKDKKTLEEQKKEFLKYLQEAEELISISNKVKETFNNKVKIKNLSLFPDLE
ncbi:MAG: hypothetical protein JHC31_03675 [Sulfurihydrogenibium sp.]|nr:hypothetical protein [Sulfurihydrogenibium sp.]